MIRLVLLSLLAACGATSVPDVVASTGASPSAGCPGDVVLQVLGSGGPIAADGRASSGYLVWVDGHASLMVDAGPGTMLRFGESGADASDLQALLISHLHVDHSADLASFFKTTNFGRRNSTLPLLGPPGSSRFPAIGAFVQSLLGTQGAYPYLGGFLGEGQPYRVEVMQVDAPDSAATVFEAQGIQVRALSVPHGPVPALAYDVQVGGTRIAFMGDQRADEARYVDMIRDADLLVAHMAIPERSPGIAAQLHAPPGRLGRVAAEANVKSMVVSHLMGRSLEDLDANLAAIRQHYAGPLFVATDGGCFDPARLGPEH